jgi:iron complex outermembrane receptor protein
MFLLCSPALAVDTFAEDEEFMDEFAFLEEAGVVESAARHKQEIGMSPSAITVITRDDIEASGAETIQDVLRMVPGMDVIMASHIFTSVTARLYWNNENQHYLVLVDGREANDELVGSTFWEIQPIFLDDVERIEVIRGPGSSLYGANALAGVISITTRAMSEETSGWARVAAGEPGMIMAGARASSRISDWGFSFSGGTELSGKFGNPWERGKEIYKVRAVVERNFSEKTRLRLEGGYTDGSGNVATALGQLDSHFKQSVIRLLYEAEGLRGQLYWSRNRGSVIIGSDLIFSGIRLAKFSPVELVIHVIDGEVQWTLPELFEPLMLITGGRVRASNLESATMLDPDYADITSPGYHQPGLDHWEARAGGFIHGELAPTDWVTVTGGVRLDYNTITGIFLSPRLAAVFQPVSGQYFRLGVSRAFRKPSAQETVTHVQAIFPDDSPITGTAQDRFQEFMARSVGNINLVNEELLSFEAAYMGQFLDGRLSVALDLYYNLHTDMSDFVSVLVPDEQGLPDLELSSFGFDNIDTRLNIIGAELNVRYSPSKYLLFQASWIHREVLENDTSPKNLLSLGGRFRTAFGLLGSLYVFSRSEFWDRAVENPDGMMADALEHHMETVLLFMGKLGWEWEPRNGFVMETGLKLFLPFSPVSGPLFRYYERGGGISPGGKHYGGEQLARALTVYLQGSF